MPSVVAKPADLIEKDPGLLGRVIVTAATLGISALVGLWLIYATYISDSYSRTTIYAANGTETAGDIPWFAWGGPLVTLMAIGLVQLACVMYYFTVLRPQLKGR